MTNKGLAAMNVLILPEQALLARVLLGTGGPSRRGREEDSPGGRVRQSLGLPTLKVDGSQGLADAIYDLLGSGATVRPSRPASRAPQAPASRASQAQAAWSAHRRGVASPWLLPS